MAHLLDSSAYVLSPYSIPPMAVSLAIFLLGLLVLFRERATRVSVLFFLVTGSVASWLWSFAFVYSASDPTAALWWVKIAHAGVALIPAAVYHFTVAATQNDRGHRFTVRTAWAVSLFFLACAVGTDQFVGGLHRYWWGYYTRYDWLALPFLAFFLGLMALSLCLYGIQIRETSSDVVARRCRWLLWAFSIGYIGSLDYLPAFGFELYPFGYLPVFGFVTLTAHAIWHYRILEITPAFAARQVMETMADALLVLDPQGMIRVVNRAACELFRRKEREMIGAPADVIQAEFMTPEILKRAASAGPLEDQEMITRADGGRTLSVSVSVMRDPLQEPAAIVCILRDITERKRAEEQLRRQTEELTKANKIKDEFLSVMSHELRTPLNVIVGFADLVKNEIFGEINSDQRDAMEKILRHARDQLGMIDSILYTTSLETYRAPVPPRPIDLREFLDDLISSSEATRDKNITFVWNFPAALPDIKVDGSNLKHVLQNLIHNAVKFTEKGRISLSAKVIAENATSPERKTWVEFKVVDTGIGIAPEEIPYIFDKFRQVDASNTRLHGGVGLGLYIAKRFTEILGGTISVESHPGQGSTFTVTVPAL